MDHGSEQILPKLGTNSRYKTPIFVWSAIEALVDFDVGFLDDDNGGLAGRFQRVPCAIFLTERIKGTISRAARLQS